MCIMSIYNISLEGSDILTVLSVRKLSKSYEKFKLHEVSFDLEEGYIMGFIGRNGAGKTTALKSMLGLVSPDCGEVSMFGRDFFADEIYCKQEIGLVMGGVDYYADKKLSAIADVTRRFYKNWDEAAFEKYFKRFGLDKGKRIKELSAGMKVKFSLALALSHHARLLILDEPTSGLDPVSRDELIEIFRDTVKDGAHSILFSTHIITDLEKCADYITYIKDGKILRSADIESFRGEYLAVSGGELLPEQREKIIGLREHKFGFEGMIKAEDAELFPEETAPISLEEIMLHIERGEDDEKSVI